MPEFKVIIIGGGPVGLSTAHALSQAGIDFVVLERRKAIVEDMGASLVLSPQSLRIMGHLGLLERFRDIGQEVLHLAAFTMQGKKFLENWHTNYLKDYNGAYPHVFHRADVVRVLYEGLVPQCESKILTNKKVVGIIPDEGGVRVACEDGTEYAGHIVLGADGVYSKTRHLMHEWASNDAARPELSPIEKTPYTAEYKTLFCSFPRLWEFAPGDFFVTHGEEVSLQLLNSRNRSWVFVYEHIPAAERKERASYFPYTEQDVEEFALKHGDINIGGKLFFRDIWRRRTNCGLTDLHEGVLPQWSYGRAVLAGDACHKFTPNAGMGFNSGLQDVMALVNGLHQCLSERAEGSLPDDEAIAAVFADYEAQRIPSIKSDCAASAMVTRLCAWPNTWFWFIDQYIIPTLPWIESFFFKYQMAREVSRGLVLSFLKAREPFQGQIPWVHTLKGSV
ncbi:hypothetical protein S40293_04874 [Stachybotrys chartarum IBT 40293]|nr:hypothetical protein S40293_04874 [Stachybotrys chartarum IBT 40293]